jgi:DNA-binding transcriptional LysR family regulator
MPAPMPLPTPPLPSARIKTRQLVLLAHLDRERSVLRAAEAVGMSQPAASKLLRELEEFLGVRLFERHARGIEPTQYGEILVRHAHSVLAEIRRAQEEVDALKQGRLHRVSIGTVVSPGAELVPMAISLLEQRHPQMIVSVEVDYSRPMVAKLLDGRLDIVIGRILDPPDAAHLHFEALAEEPHSLIARPQHPLARRRKLGVSDLVAHTWILPPDESILRERLTAMFLQHGLGLPQRIVETSSLPLITNLLRCTDMLVALPAEVVRPYCNAGMLAVLPIDLGVHMDSFGIITRRGHGLARGAAETLAALREAVAVVYGARPALAPGRRVGVRGRGRSV